MSDPGSTKRCTVAYAGPERQEIWSLEVALDASVAEVLAAARELASASGTASSVPWDGAAVGIFGEPCAREAVPRDGDRIEIYEPLREDPRLARRARAQRKRGRLSRS